MSKCRDEEVFSVVPSSWLTTDGYCFWPKTNVRYCIVKYKPPSRDWEKHAVELYGRYGTYEQALRKERKLSNYSSDSNSTESEMLGRGLRKKKVSNISEEHSDVESDEKDESDSSIPLPVSGYGELANIPGDKRNDQEAIICTDIIQPVINNETSDVILKQLIELKVICSKIDARLENIEKMFNTGKLPVGLQNYSLLPNFPLNSIEELTILEETLNITDAKFQLTNLLEMIGGTNLKDGLKRALFKLFTNQLACKCSWTGAKGNFALKELTIIECLRAALKVNFIEMKEAEFEEMLKIWFRQASLRLARQKSKD